MAKSIVVTGASSGIGAALTKALAADGHHLFICARRDELLAKISEKLPSVFYSRCDVGSENEVARFFAEVAKRTSSVDALIHCAGVMGPIGPTVEINGDEWFYALRVNLLGAFLAAKYVVPLMQPERRPRILMMSGGGSFDPMPNVSAYGVSKAAIVRLVETLAVELAPRNIAVNAIGPGFVATEIFDSMLKAGSERGGAIYEKVVNLFKGANDHDIEIPVACVRFLISEAAAALTGKTISARLDPWNEIEFQEAVQDIASSKLYATQRTNLEHLKGEAFVDRLIQAVDRQKLPHDQRKDPD